MTKPTTAPLADLQKMDRYEQLLPVPNPAPRQRAYHEAGHALVAVAVGDDLVQVSIANDESDESKGGRTRIAMRAYPLANASFCLAGASAEVAYMHHDPQTVLRTHAFHDYLEALKFAPNTPPLELIQLLVAWFTRPSVAAAVHALAAQLLQQITIDGQAAEEIIDANLGMDDDSTLQRALFAFGEAAQYR